MPDSSKAALGVRRDGGRLVHLPVTKHQIVAPNAIQVLLPVPGKPGANPTKALLTITTCNPRWASFERWIVSGVLVDTRAESKGPPPGPRREGLKVCTNRCGVTCPAPGRSES